MRRIPALILSVLLSLTTAPVMAATYFHDTFTGSNGTDLDAHTPDTGTSWTEIENTGASGQMGINTGRGIAELGSASSGQLNSADATYTTANYSVEIQLGAWSNAGSAALSLGCRVVAGLDGYFAVIFDDGVTNDVRLYRADDSVTTELGTGEITTAVTDIYRLECDGSSITLKRNGLAVIGPITDATYSAAGEAVFGAGDILDLGATIGGTGGTSQGADYFTVASIESRRPSPPILLGN